MKRNYQGVLNRLREVAIAHPQINSADAGRELELDIKKKNLWPRAFIRTEQSDINGGEGSVELTVTFTMLIVDRLDVRRSNVEDVMNMTHSVMTDVLAVLNKEQLIRLEDSPTITPLYDYHDSQVAGWSIPLKVWLDEGFQCYTV